MTAFTLVIVSFLSLGSCQSQTLSIFRRDVICDVTKRMSKGCSEEVTSTHSLMRCSSLCRLDGLCLGASVDETGKCYHHKQCDKIEVGECTVENKNHRYMAKYCVNGTWDMATLSCTCLHGFHGDRCEEYPESCDFLATAGYYSLGHYRVFIDPDKKGKKPSIAFCHFHKEGSVRYILMRNQGIMNFNKTWEDYARGFYMDEFNMWTGLDIWHHVSHAARQKLIMTLEFGLTFLTSQRKRYGGFLVANESMKYQFTYESAQSSVYGQPPQTFTFGDCLEPRQSTPFSTWDKDSDDVGRTNCASRAGSGWWYSDCNNPCNLLGYGFDYWNSKPSHQLFSVMGADMNNMASENVFFHIYFNPWINTTS